MNRRSLATLFCLSMCAASCGGPTLQPSAAATPARPSAAAVTGDAPGAPAGGAPAAPAGSAIRIEGPRGVLPGCLRAVEMPDVLEWRIFNVPAAAKIDRGYSHEDGPGCGSTDLHLRTTNDHLRADRDPLDPTTVIVRFDKQTYNCGHTQIDVSIDGQNVLGEVLDYGNEGCTPGTPPPCMVDCGGTTTPTPVKWQTDLYCGAVPTPFETLTAANFNFYGSIVLASDGTDDSQEPFGSGFVYRSTCNGVSVAAAVNRSTATVTVDQPVTVSFVAYRKDGVHVLPQIPEDGVIQMLTPGTHTLAIKVIQ